MQDDMQDLLDESNEVQELLSRSYMTPDFIDDADLDAGKMSGLHHFLFIETCRTGRFGIRTNV